MASQWYASVDGKTVGPITSKELKQLARDCSLSPDDLVRNGEAGKWVRAERVVGLFVRDDANDSLFDVSLRSLAKKFSKKRSEDGDVELAEQSVFDLTLRQLAGKFNPKKKKKRSEVAAPKSASNESKTAKSNSSEGAVKKSNSAEGRVQKSNSAEGRIQKSASSEGRVVKAKSAEKPAETTSTDSSTATPSANPEQRHFEAWLQKAAPILAKSGEEAKSAETNQPKPVVKTTFTLEGGRTSEDSFLTYVAAKREDDPENAGRRIWLKIAIRATVAVALLAAFSVAGYASYRQMEEKDYQAAIAKKKKLDEQMAAALAAKEPPPPAVDAKAEAAKKAEEAKKAEQAAAAAKAKEKIKQAITEPTLVKKFEGHTDAVHAVAFAPKSGMIASASSDKTVRLWDVEGLEKITTFDGHEGPVRCVAFSPDGRKLATGGDDKTVRVWDAFLGSHLHRWLGHADRVTAVAFLPDNKRILSASADRTLRLWDAEKGLELRTLTGPKLAIGTLAIAPNGEFALSGSTGEGEKDYGFRLWDLQTFRQIHEFQGHELPIEKLAFFGDGLHAMTADSKTIRVWCLSTGKELRKYDRPTGFITAADLDPSGNYALLAARDSVVRLFDLRTGYDTHEAKGAADYLSAAAFAPNQRYAAAAGKSKAVYLWELPESPYSAGSAIRTIDPEADSKRAAIEKASADGHWRLDPAASGAMTEGGRPREIVNTFGMKLAYLPAGSFIMGSQPAETNQLVLPPGYNPEIERAHDVTLSAPFYIGKTEVTQRQYQAVMGTNPSEFVDPEKPVEKVRWIDAVEFCVRLSWAENRSYRLPTEAEWEYACRAGATTAYSTGTTLLGTDANIQSTMNNTAKSASTAKVGGYAPNAFGLYDMHGNVAEWCFDWFVPIALAESTDPLGGFHGTYRSCRGGAWNSSAAYCRSAMRNPPEFGDPNAPSSSVGFRVVLDLPAARKLSPAPGDDAVRAEKNRIEQIFASELKKRTDADRRLLADRMFQVAMSTPDNNAARFALLDAAADSAAEAGDLDRALRAIAEIAKSYAVNTRPLECAVVDKVTHGSALRQQNPMTAPRITDRLLRAMSADDYEAASRMATALASFTKAGDAAERTRGYRNQVRELKKEFDALTPVLLELHRNDQDAKANEAIGRFYCFHKGDWSQGLPLLAKAVDPAIKKAAKAELAALTAQDSVAAADIWWDIAAREKKDQARQILLHAKNCYRRALSELNGLELARVEQRIAEIDAGK